MEQNYVPNPGGTSGVPQGSNLGALLFSLYVIDIVEIVDCEELFADDLKLFCRLVTAEDSFKLQLDLDKLFDCNFSTD